MNQPSNTDKLSGFSRSFSAAACVLAAPVFAMLLAGCTQSVGVDSEVTADDTSAIVGGQKVTSSDAVAKTTVSIVDVDPEIGQFCTGIVVDRNTVLTAAHCFDDRSHVPAVRPATGTRTAIAARAVAVHAKYSQSRREAFDASIETVKVASKVTAPTSALNDVALVFLDKPLPADVKPAVFASTDIDLVSESLVSAGYGCTSTACTAATDILKKVAMHYVTTAPRANLVVLEAGAKKGTCFGDSGGPDFAVTSRGLQVFAVISTGPEACELGISVDTLVAPYVSWIEKTSQLLREGKSSSSTFVRINY